jgi:hypothetical protein
MEYLILVLIVGMVYLRFHMNKEERSHEDEFDRIKDALDNAIAESPYKLEPIEPIVATKRKTRKRTVKKVVLKKPKKKVVKKKTVKKKRKTK